MFSFPEIFKSIGKDLQNRVGQVFFEAGTDIEKMPADKAWSMAVKKCEYITEEDKNVLVRFSVKC